MLDTVFLTQREKAVLKRIPKGTKDKITRKELSKLFNASERTVKDIIYHLRKKGIPVMANRENGHGYWLPTTRKELHEGLSPYKKQVEEELNILNAMTHSSLDYEKLLEDEQMEEVEK
ncbi:HTH domain-containing protein [Carnobacteriaceae bacterium zg-ZUI78]|nr:HTH domain-containing protein [Carnobacteriaceae bacterium zg-ZUI78]